MFYLLKIKGRYFYRPRKQYLRHWLLPRTTVSLFHLPGPLLLLCLWTVNMDCTTFDAFVSAWSRYLKHVAIKSVATVSHLVRAPEQLTPSLSGAFYPTTLRVLWYRPFMTSVTSHSTIPKELPLWSVAFCIFERTQAAYRPAYNHRLSYLCSLHHWSYDLIFATVHVLVSLSNSLTVMHDPLYKVAFICLPTLNLSPSMPSSQAPAFSIPMEMLSLVIATALELERPAPIKRVSAQSRLSATPLTFVLWLSLLTMHACRTQRKPFRLALNLYSQATHYSNTTMSWRSFPRHAL